MANHVPPRDAAAPQPPISGARSPLVVIFVTVFIDLVGFGIVIPLLPRYAEDYGASELVGALLFSTYSLMQFVAPSRHPVRQRDRPA